ncbi:Stage II sporulation protein E [Bienertia sinuspersici]
MLAVNKPVVLALVETHMGGEQAEYVALKFGFGGHLRVYWRTEIVHIEPIDQSTQHIIMEIIRNGEILWYFTTIYASPDHIKRHDLWEHLKSFAMTHNQPWVLGGDFNDTRYN